MSRKNDIGHGSGPCRPHCNGATGAAATVCWAPSPGLCGASLRVCGLRGITLGSAGGGLSAEYAGGRRGGRWTHAMWDRWKPPTPTCATNRLAMRDPSRGADSGSDRPRVWEACPAGGFAHRAARVSAGGFCWLGQRHSPASFAAMFGRGSFRLGGVRSRLLFVLRGVECTAETWFGLERCLSTLVCKLLHLKTLVRGDIADEPGLRKSGGAVHRVRPCSGPHPAARTRRLGISTTRVLTAGCAGFVVRGWGCTVDSCGSNAGLGRGGSCCGLAGAPRGAPPPGRHVHRGEVHV